jgi:gliding motility-associated lipoprotein GldD
MLSRKIDVIIFSCLAILFASCGGDNIPKPKGYFRIDLPKKEYNTFSSDCPFTFSYPAYSTVVPYKGSINEKCWYNVEFPKFKGTIHLSYYPIDNNLAKHIEDSRALAYKHSVKASSIDENVLSSGKSNVHGLLYEITGNAASSVQFYLTDSTHHFIRGALYFNASPNFDSISPVQEFVRMDIDTLLSSFRWK